MKKLFFLISVFIFLLACSNKPNIKILETKSECIDYYECCTIYHFDKNTITYYDSLNIDLAIKWLNYKYPKKQHKIEFHQYSN